MKQMTLNVDTYRRLGSKSIRAYCDLATLTFLKTLLLIILCSFGFKRLAFKLVIDVSMSSCERLGPTAYIYKLLQYVTLKQAKVCHQINGKCYVK